MSQGSLQSKNWKRNNAHYKKGKHEHFDNECVKTVYLFSPQPVIKERGKAQRRAAAGY